MAVFSQLVPVKCTLLFTYGSEQWSITACLTSNPRPGVVPQPPEEHGGAASVRFGDLGLDSEAGAAPHASAGAAGPGSL